MSRVVRTKCLGFDLTVPPTVFHPKFYFTSHFLGAYISKLQLSEKHVLDAGCGSGILALSAARQGGTVFAIDVNPSAIQATTDNARRAGLHTRVFAIESDLLRESEDGERRFDFILSNPPFFSGIARDMAQRAFRSGPENDFLVRLSQLSLSRLAPGGAVLLVLSSDADVEACLRPFKKAGFSVSVADVRRLPFEQLTIFELQRSQCRFQKV